MSPKQKKFTHKEWRINEILFFLFHISMILSSESQESSIIIKINFPLWRWYSIFCFNSNNWYWLESRLGISLLSFVSLFVLRPMKTHNFFTERIFISTKVPNLDRKLFFMCLNEEILELIKVVWTIESCKYLLSEKFILIRMI